MILLVHLLFGAAIGSLVKNVPLALILAFLSHWVVDMIPHFDIPKISKSKKIILGSTDLILSIILLVRFILYFSPSIYLIIGVFILSLFPDLFFIIEIFTGKKLLKRIFFDFHLGIQNEFSWGWIVELGFLIAICCFLFLK